MRNQQTLAAAVTCSGVGLHSGQPVTLTLRPAPPDTGIVFVNRNGHAGASLSASIKHRIPSEHCTAISGNGFQVKTIEHVLAALSGLEIDNVFIDVTASEVPAMDGSAGPFVRLIQSAGVLSQNRRQPYLKIMAPIEVSEGSKWIRIEPSPTLRITYSIHYTHPLIQAQRYRYDHSVSAFERDIADARTFGFLHEVEALWSRGLAKGGSLDNTIVLTRDGILNMSGLRYGDEFVRHKVLDLIGDLALLGVPVIGHLIAERSGHTLHTRLVEHILQQPDKWVLLNTHEDSSASVSHPVANGLRSTYSSAMQASTSY